MLSSMIFDFVILAFALNFLKENYKFEETSRIYCCSCPTTISSLLLSIGIGFILEITSFNLSTTWLDYLVHYSNDLKKRVININSLLNSDALWPKIPFSII